MFLLDNILLEGMHCCVWFITDVPREAKVHTLIETDMLDKSLT